MAKSNYRLRANVLKFLPIWQKRVTSHGKEQVEEELRKGKTIILTRKDRIGLLQRLGMED